MPTWIQDQKLPTWETAHLHGGPHDGHSLDVPTGILAAQVGPPWPATTYHRTRQHCEARHRVYHAWPFDLWPANSTLGWTGPEGFAIGSDFDRCDGRWYFVLSGHGHTLRFNLSAYAVETGRHQQALAGFAARISRTQLSGRLPARVE